ncbi:MAG: hypothetical protein COU11_02720 [Candidatus Harrisonbacteria bacterium CG10_big_fil_rev_8_21_14_0_10_49_15]|uniref:AI-2E family transporter n=1 Tax=Candidatus Harrisonbacteria bacterium CG10_big_fil_rev_8_21_14_0_10_49_15 TaxID=1974587 RepID=A0A2H0UN72_9BACT|nr:MAG: hypothetical protein COU11_02720 [Candidatus Harrisonbacteria bacterium CG10_big_fil_rev_8_21_14_0_10_49_15]
MPSKEELQINITWGVLWKVLAMGAFVAILFGARDILIATLLAIILSSALDPFVTYLERRRIPRLLGTLMIYLLTLLALTLLIYIILPVFLVELNSFIHSSVDLSGSLSQSLGVNLSIFETFTATINQFIADLSGGTTTFVALMSQVLGGIVTMIVIAVISFYLTVGRDGVERFLFTVLPPAYQVPVLSVYERVREKISSWFAGQLFISLMVGIAVYIGLAMLGVKYAFILAITAAVLELVPFVGPIFSGTVAILIALSSSGVTAFYTFILFLVIQQLEQHFLVPAVNKYTTDLNPVIVILALLIGGKVFGILGVILAVPVAVAVQEVMRYWANSRRSEGEQQTVSEAA